MPSLSLPPLHYTLNLLHLLIRVCVMCTHIVTYLTGYGDVQTRAEHPLRRQVISRSEWETHVWGKHGSASPALSRLCHQHLAVTRHLRPSFQSWRD